jgi:cytoskeleton protein RodZ
MYVADLIPPVPDAITRALEAGRTGIAAVADRARNDPTSAAARQTEPPAVQPKAAEPMSAEPRAAVEPAPVAPAAAPATPGVVTEAPAVAASPSVAETAPAPVQSAPGATQPVQVPAVAADTASHDEDEDEAERTPPPSPAAAPAQASRTASQTASPMTSQTAVAVPAAQPSASAPAPSAVSDAPPVALDDRGGVDAPATGSQLASLPGAAGDPDRQIVLKANVDSWIQIRDTTENKLVLTRLLRKGEQYVVPAREGLTLVTGNAGGLEVTVGGDSTPSLGPIGVVRRNIMLDPERLRAGTAIVE